MCHHSDKADRLVEQLQTNQFHRHLVLAEVSYCQSVFAHGCDYDYGYDCNFDFCSKSDVAGVSVLRGDGVVLRNCSDYDYDLSLKSY